MKEILERLKSPVVIIQLIGTVEVFLIGLSPDITKEVKLVCTFLISIINILAGLNNPTDRSNF